MNIPPVDGLVLSDGKVLVRPYQRDDIERLYEAAIESVETVYPWLLWCHPKYSMAESEQWVKSRPAEWAAGNSFEFVMVDPKNSRFVGACGLNQFRMEHKIANLGYWVRRTAMGRSEEHTSELQSLAYLVCRLLLEKKKMTMYTITTCRQ